MKFYDVMLEAKQAGYTCVDDGAQTWAIDDFIMENRDEPGDFTLEYTGQVKRFKDDGYLESGAIYTCKK